MYHNLISKLDQCRNEQNGKYFFLVFDKNLTVSTLFTRDFLRHFIRANFATLWSEKVAYHFTLIYFYTVHWHEPKTYGENETSYEIKVILSK